MESRKSEAPTLDLAPPLETSWLERIFKLKQHGSTVKTEMIAGVTTFITMAYIIFVNPNIMADAGIDMVPLSSPPASPPRWAAC